MRNMKITIDAGHGYNANKSPVNSEYYEGTRMWYLGNMLASALEEYGFETVMTRPNINDNPPVYDRGKMAGENGSDLFISLHSNAIGKSANGEYDTSISGTTCYRSLANEAGDKLGDDIGETVAALMGHKFRGTKTKKYSSSKPDTDYYGVLRGAAQNGCTLALIVEHGFHTNPDDVEFLLDDDNLQAIADAEAAIIGAYFGVEKKAEESYGEEFEIALNKLKKRHSGKQVETMQILLNAYGYECPVTGDFDDLTRDALKAYQKANKLTVDGRCGRKTWERLIKG